MYPDANHDSWTDPYNSQGLYDWFLSHKKKPSPQPSTPGSYSQSFTASPNQTPLPYLLTIPKKYQSKGNPSPLILFLHGAGERGADLDRVKIHSPLNFANDNPDEFPFILLSPQCSTNHTWLNELKDLASLLDNITSRYNVDPDRIYLTGLSMGGFATWALAAEYPQRFAALVPICGGGQSWNTSKLKNIPTWAFHGDNDKVVPHARSENMINALIKAGNQNAKLTTYPGVGHNAWTKTYNNPKLYQWLLKHKKK
ncbi:MAG: alpha/beta fold hydrolase [Planctomycetes bacterium]|nr:alpha/beta fold hydrolase [Planctomycetota bacterium]